MDCTCEWIALAKGKGECIFNFRGKGRAAKGKGGAAVADFVQSDEEERRRDDRATKEVRARFDFVQIWGLHLERPSGGDPMAEKTNMTRGYHNRGIPNDQFAPAGSANGSESDTNNWYSLNDNDEYEEEEEEEAEGSSRMRSRIKKKRHKPHQIKELDRFFSLCPHPDEKQRAELGRRIELDPTQVKFWFQNKRTQTKSKVLQYENKELREEYDRLFKENMMLRRAFVNPICTKCGGTDILVDLSLHEEHLRDENAKLKEQLSGMWAVAETIMGKSQAKAALSNFNLPIEIRKAEPLGSGVAAAWQSSLGVQVPGSSNGVQSTGHDLDYNSFPYLAIAISHMQELLALAQKDEALWYKLFDGGKDILNMEEYSKRFSPFGDQATAPGFVTHATRESAEVPISASELVKAFTSCDWWVKLFPGMISQATIHEQLYSGEAGELQMMSAEFLFPSPFVPLRRDKFIRYCIQHQGTWIVVDSSVKNMADGFYTNTMKCRRLPSGIIVQDLNNESSLVTWIEHLEYDETCAHPMYRALLRSGVAFSAHRWLATLKRQCECCAIIPKNIIISSESGAMSEAGTRSVVKLAGRMNASFGSAICGSSKQGWKKINMMIEEDIQMMTRSNCSNPGEPIGVVLSMAKSIHLPVSRAKVFSFLSDLSTRGKWCILSYGAYMLEFARISHCQDTMDSITVLYPPAAPENEKNMLILQQAWTDETGSLMVYAPLEVDKITAIMSGQGNPDIITILPSGFAIADALDDSSIQDILGGSPCTTGSILTMNLQVLYSNNPGEDPTPDFVKVVNDLFSHTINEIKAALTCS
ncbi:hypothetical protein Droror1_Dr00009543 [Drosera rotundifolia]